MKPIKFDSETIETIREFAKTHTKMQCCNRFTLKPDVFSRVAREHGIQYIYSADSDEDDSCHIKYDVPDGMIVDGKGYIMCVKPDWYTGRKHSKYVYYHSVVMCESLGITEIPKGFTVRHLDGDKQNNDISNLILLSLSANSRFDR